MIEYDIDLSNLSKKAQKNFRKYYKRNKGKVSAKKNTKLYIIMAILCLLPCVFAGVGAKLSPLCKIKYELLSIPFLIIGLIPLAIFLPIIKRYLKRNEIKNETGKKFFEYFANDNVFNYCFECNNKVIPTTKAQCPICYTTTKLRLVEKITTLHSLEQKAEHRILKGSNFFHSIFNNLLLSALTFSLIGMIINLMKDDSMLRAYFDFEHKNYQYLEPTPINIDDTEKNDFDEIIRYENGIPVKEEHYMSFGFPDAEKLFLGKQSKHEITQYCEDYNSHMKKYIDGTYKKGELGTVKTFGSSRLTYQKYLNSSTTLIKLTTYYFIDDNVKFDGDKTGIITALIISKANGIKYIITDQNNKEYTRKGCECKLIKTKNGEKNVRNKTK